MPGSDLSELIAGKSEDLGVEYKAWMDTSQPEVRAKLARHIAALSNHGGGYLIFGVDDTTREPQGATALDPSLFSQDAISAIVKRYLDPRIQVRVEQAEHAGVLYPVVIVPSHGARPVIAVNDGPQDDKGRRVGIRQGKIYIRAAGPESVQIKHTRMTGIYCSNVACRTARIYWARFCGNRSPTPRRRAPAAAISFWLR